MNPKFFTGAGLSLSLLCAGATVRAQAPNASQQSDSVQQRQQLEAATRLMVVPTNAAPEFYPGETGDVGPQSLVLHARHPLLQASADEQYFYSDNVFLSNIHKQGADVLVSTLNIALTPAPVALAGGTLAPRIGYQHQWFNYGLAGDEPVIISSYSGSAPVRTHVDVFNFNSATPFVDLTWSRGDWTATLGEDFRWLLDSSSYDQFYREFVTRWSIGRTFRLSDAASIYLGYEGDYRFTDSQLPPNDPSSTTFPPARFNEEFNDRTDQGIVLVSSFRLCPHAILQPYDHLKYTCYSFVKRHDYLNSVGIALYCPITSQITLRTFVSYDIMHTDGFYVQSYKQFGAGGGLNLTIRF